MATANRLRKDLATAVDPRVKMPSTVLYRGKVDRVSLKELMNRTPNFYKSTLQEVHVDPAKNVDSSGKTKLGWFEGVLVPVLLNIWGVIMFLRLGWVAGQAGLGYGTLIIVASNVVTTITTLSLCAICTNGEVGGGGAYYLISRALGPSFGGAIGLLFFVAQAVATSMYVVGFAESVVDILKKSGADPFTGSFAWDQRVIGLATSVLLLGVAMIGVGWYAKCQIILLVILIISILSVLIGVFLPGVPDAQTNSDRGFVGWRPLSEALDPQFSTDPDTGTQHGFFTVFAVFFPAVTGIMAGANMSGDLKDASKAIPKGTLWGIAITFVSYVGLLWLVGAVSERCSGNDEYCSAADYGTEAWAQRVSDNNVQLGGLVYNKLIMENISLWGPLVYAGVFAATLSSALASLVGAPRILQAVAKDRLFDTRFITFFGPPQQPQAVEGIAKASGSGSAAGAGAGAGGGADPEAQQPTPARPAGPQEDPEPRAGYVLTFFICCGCVLIGQLDIIAPLISNFFMISYAMTNYACFAASASLAPGWRPSFKYFNPYVSMFGALLCILVMFAFDWLNSLISVVIGVGVFQYLEWKKPLVDWGPAGNAKKYVSAVTAMRHLVRVQHDSSGQGHVKTFRPQLLVLCGNPESRPAVVRFAQSLYKGRGVLIFANIIDAATVDPNKPRSEISYEAREQGLTYLKAGASDDHDASGASRYSFMEAIVAASLRDGLQSVLQLGGMGALRPNTAVIGYKQNWKQCSLQQVEEYEQLLFDVMRADLGLCVVRDENEFFKDPTGVRMMMSRILSRRAVSSGPGSAGQQRRRRRRIDVWWTDDDGGLTALLPHLLRKNPEYKNYELRVLVLAASKPEDELRAEAVKQTMIHLLNKFRIKATVCPVDADVKASPSDATMKTFKRLFPDLVPDRFEKGNMPPSPAVLGKRLFPLDEDEDMSNGSTPSPSPPPADQAAAAPPPPPPAAGDGAASTGNGDAAGAGAGAGVGGTVEPMSPLRPAEISVGSPEDLEQYNIHTRRYLRLGEIIREYSSDASVVFISLPLPNTNVTFPPKLYMMWLEALSEDLPSTVLMRGNNKQALTFFS